MLFFGIDPGAGGGIAVLHDDGSVRLVAKMPETERDMLDLIGGEVSAGDLRSPARAVLERVWSSPQMGVASSFKFGVGIGLLRMALTAARIPFDEVTPQKWQKEMGCRAGASRATEGAKGGDKNITKRRAQQLFPDQAVTHATADALLIATYCRRVHLGLTDSAPAPKPSRRPRAAKTSLF